MTIISSHPIFTCIDTYPSPEKFDLSHTIQKYHVTHQTTFLSHQSAFFLCLYAGVDAIITIELHYLAEFTTFYVAFLLLQGVCVLIECWFKNLEPIPIAPPRFTFGKKELFVKQEKKSSKSQTDTLTACNAIHKWSWLPARA